MYPRYDTGNYTEQVTVTYRTETWVTWKCNKKFQVNVLLLNSESTDADRQKGTNKILQINCTNTQVKSICLIKINPVLITGSAQDESIFKRTSFHLQSFMHCWVGSQPQNMTRRIETKILNNKPLQRLNDQKYLWYMRTRPSKTLK